MLKLQLSVMVRVGLWPVQVRVGLQASIRGKPAILPLSLVLPYQDLTDSSSFDRAKFWVKELRSLEEVGDRPHKIMHRDCIGLWR